MFHVKHYKDVQSGSYPNGHRTCLERPARVAGRWRGGLLPSTVTSGSSRAPAGRVATRAKRPTWKPKGYALRRVHFITRIFLKKEKKEKKRKTKRWYEGRMNVELSETV